MPPPKPDKLMLHFCQLAFSTIFLAIPLAALKMPMLETSQPRKGSAHPTSPEQGLVHIWNHPCYRVDGCTAAAQGRVHGPVLRLPLSALVKPGLIGWGSITQPKGQTISLLLTEHYVIIYKYLAFAHTIIWSLEAADFKWPIKDMSST